MIVGSVEPGSKEEWRWLVDDGWTDDVRFLDPYTSASSQSGNTLKGDVILVRSTQSLALAVAAALPTATIVVEMGRGRQPIWRTRSELTRAGFTEQRVYLATPNLDRPLRLTPLADANGMRWLVSLLRSKGRRRAAALDRLSGPAAAVLRTPIGSLVGNRLMIATRRAPNSSSQSAVARPGLDHLLGSDVPDSECTDSECTDAVLMTSGHDEGSRVVLLPLAPGASEPSWVMKISARPAFNRNVDDEVAVITSIRDAIDASDRDNVALPQVSTVFDHGLLRGSKERYAGRSTAADVCYHSPGRQREVLERVMAAMTDLHLAAEFQSGGDPWTADQFNRLVQAPFDRYCQLMGPQSKLSLLVADLVERSEQLIDRPLPQVQRHYDLGPWNVVFDHDRLTIIDWERAEPRTLSGTGPAGADLLYFAKYWLHIALGTASVDDEVNAFEFLDDPDTGSRTGEQSELANARSAATEVIATQLERLGVNRGFVPILAMHLWLEKALYTIARRQVGAEVTAVDSDAADPGDAARYLEVLALHRIRLLDHWPLDEQADG